jgi:hypothetical protein
MPYSPLEVNRRFGGKSGFYLQGRRIGQARNQCESMWQAEQPAFTLVSCLAFLSTLEMEVAYSPETSVGFQRTTRRFNSEVRSPHYRRCKILKSYKGHLDMNISPILVTE